MQVIPFGMVTIIVNVDPGPEVRISTTPPSLDIPIATGASAYFEDRESRTALRVSQEDFSGVSALPTGEAISENPKVIKAAIRININSVRFLDLNKAPNSI